MSYSEVLKEIEAIVPPDEGALDRLMSKVKGRMLIHGKAAGLMGSLVLNHRYVWSQINDTAWCNGTTIGFNPKFFMYLTMDERVAVLAHEVLHTAMDHMNRIGSRQPMLWNVAADYVINLQLLKWDFKIRSVIDRVGGMLDYQYDNMSTEQVYDKLVEQIESNTFWHDDVMISMPSSGSIDDADITMSGIGGDLIEPDSPDDASKAKQNVVKAIQAEKALNGVGDIPGEVQRVVNSFLRPQLSWEILLMDFFTDLADDDYTWKVPNRRYEYDILPSRSGGEKLGILNYYIDVSGSITERQYQHFMSEAKYIHEQLKPEALNLISFDMVITNEKTVDLGDPFEELSFVGGGGTSLVPVLEHIEKTQPMAAVIFSDLHCQPMEHDPKIPIIWIIIDNDAANVSFGRPVMFKSEKI